VVLAVVGKLEIQGLLEKQEQLILAEAAEAAETAEQTQAQVVLEF
jgi:hypothetical protein